MWMAIISVTIPILTASLNVNPVIQIIPVLRKNMVTVIPLQLVDEII